MVLASSHLLLVTSGAVIGGAREFTSVVNEVCVAQAFIFCELFSRLLFDHLFLSFHYYIVFPSYIYCF